MADLPKLETSGFTAKENNNTRACPGASPSGEAQNHPGAGSGRRPRFRRFSAWGLGLMACALVCSILLVQEPFVETMAGNVESAMIMSCGGG